ncbi:RNA polymerase sigma factor [uncultured Caudovirales phage]|jgi:hypothetical protein|uniref:RNA polymerase sigma factor n=1 Tax=uncultured Caudovirales phage TaxID=2100421 RepID=A0A6J5Q7Z9_9CAUD|nr:RNA polymerase sigma factor [uncultured Caudovirales phage]
MARKKRGDTHYINNKDFTADIIQCKKAGELSDFSVNCFISLANRAVDRLYFKDYRDREDCIQSAILDCLKYWKSFDESKMAIPNAFAYFTQICKNGYAKEWKKIHKKTGLDPDDTLEFISISTSGESSVYSI